MRAASIFPIEYGFSDEEGRKSLRQQKVRMPERDIMVGFQRKGPMIEVSGEEFKFKSLPVTHHAGGRECVIEYQTVNLAGEPIDLPSRITVIHGTGKNKLRSACLFNYAPVKEDADTISQHAKHLSHFSPSELECRRLFLKYWLNPPTEVDETDLGIVRRLHAHFGGKSLLDMTEGERLKQINMLMQLEWMIGDMAGLKRQFRIYLKVLQDAKLHKMVLVGGQTLIETTLRWGQFAAAESMLKVWLDFARAVQDVEMMLTFAEASIKKGRLNQLMQDLKAQAREISSGNDKVAEVPEVGPSRK